MTVGLGIDLVDVDELRAAAQRQPEKYLQRIFTSREMAYAELQADPIQCLAGKLAAKEACMKSLRTGWSDEVDWLHLEVLNDAEGAPCLELHQGAADRLIAISGKATLVSISHLSNIAVSVVVIEE